MKGDAILLIRHAETDLAGTFCGSSNPSVNPAGERQIALLVETLRTIPREPLRTIYSSSLHRALTTAQRIADCFSASVSALPALNEIHFGDWESLTWRQIEERDPAYARQWIAEYPHRSAPGGESFECFETRVLDAFDRLTSRNEPAAIVTHAGVLRVILTRRCGMIGEQAWRQTKDYCSVFSYPIREAVHAIR